MNRSSRVFTVEDDDICVKCAKDVEYFQEALAQFLADDEGDKTCLKALQNVEEIEGAWEFIDDYDKNQKYTQRWRVSGCSDNFDVVDLMSDTESDPNTNNVMEEIAPSNNPSVNEIITISSSSDLENICSNRNWVESQKDGSEEKDLRVTTSAPIDQREYDRGKIFFFF